MAINKTSAKQYKILVNTGKAETNQSVDVAQGAGERGQPVRIKAQPGVKYQLQEIDKAKSAAPEYVKVRRVGKDLHITFEDDTSTDVIIEDYYSVMPEGYNGVIGKAENGAFYEYVPEDPQARGLIPELAEGGQAVNVALGGQEVQGAGAALAVFAFGPLLGALGLAGAAVALAASSKGGAAAGITGALDPSSDSGVLGDHKTNDNTPTLSGTAPVGSTASVTVNGVSYPVTVNPDGTWAFTNPTNLPDGTYYPVLSVTQNGVTTATNLTPFTIDTTPPTVAITSSVAALAAGETAVITFTLSELSSDFAADDIAVSGGSLSSLVQSATDPKVYTATFTPSTAGNTTTNTTASTNTTATISVASDKFADAAANRNTDGLEANNTVTLKTNATITGALTATAPNDTSGNAVAVTNVKASGTTTKVLMETFDNLPYNSTDSMWDFTTANGIQFQSQIGGTVLPNFTQLNGQLVINNAILPTNSTSQWAVMPLNGTIINATFDYNGINNATTSGTAVVRLLNNSAVAAGPFNLANNALASAPGVFNQTGTFDEINFTAGHTYAQYSNSGATLFVDELMTKVNV